MGSEYHLWRGHNLRRRLGSTLGLSEREDSWGENQNHLLNNAIPGAKEIQSRRGKKKEVNSITPLGAVQARGKDSSAFAGGLVDTGYTHRVARTRGGTVFECPAGAVAVNKMREYSLARKKMP